MRWLSIVVTLVVAVAALATPAGAVDFEREIEPIFIASCYECHGSDKIDGGLRLDYRGMATAGGDSGPAIVPGDAQASLLIERVQGDSSHGPRMPLDGRPLTDAQVALLVQWIEAGASYPEARQGTVRRTSNHWAFQPVSDPDAPPVSNEAWVRNEIDRFILAELERRDIEPSPEADRYTLIRRVSLDLTGLPPTPEQVEAFVNDDAPDAYERLVERLLASPHYGERWGRHWLDEARYADSDGYAIDGARSIWPYRDWVIAAINDDMPFDQFTIEQLAGDLLDRPTEKQLIATGFNRNTLVNREGGTDDEQFRVEATVDRTNTIGDVWLGLTLACAQCHTHKFDPVTQREYFQLYAFFNSAADRNRHAPVQEVAPPLREHYLAAMQRKLEALRDELQSQADDPVPWQAGSVVTMASEAGAEMTQLEDGSILVSGTNLPRESYTITVSFSAATQVTGLRLEALPHESLPRGGPGRADNGNFVLRDVEVNGRRPTHAWADHSQKDHPIEDAIDGSLESGWAINVSQGNMNVPRTAVFTMTDPVLVDGNGQVTVTLHFAHPKPYNLGRFRISLTDSRDFMLRQQMADLEERIEEVAQSRVRTLVMRDRREPRETRIHIRGDFLRPGDLVEADVPEVLPPMEVDGNRRATRLDLARWLVRPDNPLTPRVTVNRIWMRYFGTGLVETENDFGLQGSSPSHPELLDHLASRFMRENWSLKAMHRYIVTSATYRQSAVVRDDLCEIDPLNRLLARQQRLRVDAELVRDQALAASGALVPTLGGPSVFPPQPDGVYAFTQRAKQWVASTGDDRYRRTMYTFFYRSAPYPLLSTFDVPNFNASCTARRRSNTPLQSLATANAQAMTELFQHMAVRVLTDLPEADDRERIIHAFRLALVRMPTDAELATLERYFDQQLSSFRENVTAAEQVAPATVAFRDDIARVAAHVAAARLIMNTDEFVTRP